MIRVNVSQMGRRRIADVSSSSCRRYQPAAGMGANQRRGAGPGRQCGNGGNPHRHRHARRQGAIGADRLSFMMASVSPATCPRQSRRRCRPDHPHAGRRSGPCRSATSSSGGSIPVQISPAIGSTMAEEAADDDADQRKILCRAHQPVVLDVVNAGRRDDRQKSQRIPEMTGFAHSDLTRQHIT